MEGHQLCLAGGYTLGKPSFKTHLERPWQRISCATPLYPCQMWMSVWRGQTTATSMLSARTPHGHTSASASLATQGTASTAKVRLGSEKGDLWEKKPVPLPSAGHIALPQGLKSLLAKGGWLHLLRKGICVLIHTKTLCGLAEAPVGIVDSHLTD